MLDFFQHRPRELGASPWPVILRAGQEEVVHGFRRFFLFAVAARFAEVEEGAVGLIAELVRSARGAAAGRYQCRSETGGNQPCDQPVFLPPQSRASIAVAPRRSWRR